MPASGASTTRFGTVSPPSVQGSVSEGVTAEMVGRVDPRAAVPRRSPCMDAWPDAIDEVLAGDLPTAVAYTTPAGGAVATAVAPIGLRARAAGELTFTTSLGFSKKIDRLRKDPKVALAYHAREHGFAAGNER